MGQILKEVEEMGGYSLKTMAGEELAYFGISEGEIWRQVHTSMDDGRALREAFLACDLNPNALCRKNGCLDENTMSTSIVADRDKLIAAHKKLRDFLDANPSWHREGDFDWMELPRPDDEMARRAVDRLLEVLPMMRGSKVRILGTCSDPDKHLRFRRMQEAGELFMG